MKKTIEQSIKNKLDEDIYFVLFGSVNLSSIKANLKTDGFKRIPNEKRLKSIIKKLYKLFCNHKRCTALQFIC